jgi:hypothetical protein
LHRDVHHAITSVFAVEGGGEAGTDRAPPGSSEEAIARLTEAWAAKARRDVRGALAVLLGLDKWVVGSQLYLPGVILEEAGFLAASIDWYVAAIEVEENGRAAVQYW